MRRPPAPVLALAAAALAAGLAGCSGSASAQTQDAVIAPGDRAAAPHVSGPTTDGGTLDLSGVRARAVVVNFWGSWCGPCQDEAPMLADAVTRLAPDGVRFVGVDFRDSRVDAETFRKERHLDYPSLFDPDGSLTAQFDGVTTVPVTLVLDGSGRVAWRTFGEVRASALLSAARQVAAETAGP